MDNRDLGDVHIGDGYPSVVPIGGKKGGYLFFGALNLHLDIHVIGGVPDPSGKTELIRGKLGSVPEPDTGDASTEKNMLTDDASFVCHAEPPVMMMVILTAPQRRTQSVLSLGC